MNPFLLIISLFFLLVTSWAHRAEAQGKRVVTYIEDIQEERKTTRWTLTEWLRIKERMKLMDVWLAMFSDPAKAKFAPELSLTYSRGGGSSQYHLGTASDFGSDQQNYEDPHLREGGRLQFWFTNLVSSSTGLHTLDIDLGLEGSFTNRFMDDNQVLSSPDNSLSFATDTDKLQMAGLNFRIFGANVQDSTLVAKVGKFNRSSGFTAAPWQAMSGTYYGGEMALYFMRFLGAEGHYYSLKPDTKEGEKGSGSQLDYGGFLEIYNVRLGYTLYEQAWSFSNEDLRLDSKEKGRSYFIRLYF